MTATPSYTPTNFVGVSSDAVFRLVVNDGRCDCGPATVTVIVKNDSDGDEEEITGTDGAGASAGDEALAGTSPNDSASVFRVTQIAPAGGGIRIEWPAVSGKTYFVEYRTEFVESWTNLAVVTAPSTGITNVTDGTTGGAAKRLYRIRLPVP